MDPLIVPGVSGALVERRDDIAASEAALADAFAGLWSQIQAGAVDPARVSALVEPYSVNTQMARLFAHHRALQGGCLPA